jgi:endonuclease/exonuclease/phosphatase (EEP) superfamily protein YafD
MSEDFKKYLPWIIGGIVVLLILRKFLSGGQTQQAIVPQTQFVQTPQTDPLAQLRGEGFTQLAQFGLGAIQAEAAAATAQAQTAAQTALAQSNANLQYNLANKNIDAQLQQTQIMADAQAAAADLNYQQRANDVASQQAAINRYYSSVNQANILGSVNTALKNIFGGGGGIFGGGGGVFGGVSPIIWN